MRLIRFKVTNFRSVVDSGWIDAERVTALIGVNESGKTNLLLPLWKLNPAREGDIKPTSDYPKGNYAAVRAAPGSFQFIHAEFVPTDAIKTKLAELTGLDENSVALVCVHRFFDGRHTVTFPNFKKADTLSSAELVAILTAAETDISAMNQLGKEGSLKADIQAALASAKQSDGPVSAYDAEALDAVVTPFSALLPETPAPTSSIVPRLNLLIQDLQVARLKLLAPAPNEIDAVKQLVIESLPRFVYYSNYGNLDSEIYLPHVVQNLAREDLGAKEAAKARTLRVLFNFVQLQPQQILELGRDFRDPSRQPNEQEIAEIATKKRERTILLNSAGTDLTKKFRDWWRQGDYTFEFQADGDHFRIWVSDSKRPEKIELEDRSSGLQWFLSFYLIFLVESSGVHADAILLLDEPGLSLHPLAQRDLSAFFENLASTNQIIYTTHSPFLVDADMLDRVRKVFVSDDGSTKSSSDLRQGSDNPRRAGATYAIYSALNMSLAESILYGCHPVIVEGPSDQHSLALIKTVLIANKKITPKRELVFPPSHGANNAKVIASILGGKDEVLPNVLLDGDDAGKKMARDLQNGLYQSAKGKVKTTDKYVGFANSEIEDLFPQDFLVAAVDRWGRKADVPFVDVVKSGVPIVPQIEAWAKSQGVPLDDGWKVDVAREAKRRALESTKPLFDNATLDNWAKLFEDLLSES
ncbi:AAA family ATPase [Bradyrhizobium zhanjiangense]|uniref:ATP-dependent OLD family endonuclease n=1 Tax=Bradyrhizobium zhanjiangense TaxID=1325107 RepID=A0A4Q0RXH5_9BRAD|nr:AAA family ATPase [Bradyrhizobium zhanjiangense]RXH22990.1 ATP-dependent OLD family endonuclease [Bradyrhizobium zhanjiangense]